VTLATFSVRPGRSHFGVCASVAASRGNETSKVHTVHAHLEVSLPVESTTGARPPKWLKPECPKNVANAIRRHSQTFSCWPAPGFVALHGVFLCVKAFGSTHGCYSLLLQRITSRTIVPELAVCMPLGGAHDDRTHSIKADQSP
jgi:hypothetical protein